MECPQYYVMRYEAYVGEDTPIWERNSQVGSHKLISDRIEKYELQPDKYRNIRMFSCKEGLH